MQVWRVLLISFHAVRKAGFVPGSAHAFSQHAARISTGGHFVFLQYLTGWGLGKQCRPVFISGCSLPEIFIGTGVDFKLLLTLLSNDLFCFMIKRKIYVTVYIWSGDIKLLEFLVRNT